jgi:hypothetical protein
MQCILIFFIAILYFLLLKYDHSFLLNIVGYICIRPSFVNLNTYNVSCNKLHLSYHCIYDIGLQLCISAYQYVVCFWSAKVLFFLLHNPWKHEKKICAAKIKKLDYRDTLKGSHIR